MPRLIAVGHVTWDAVRGQDLLGGSVSYAALCALKLGWEAAIVTAAGDQLDPARELPGVEVHLRRSRRTTRFENVYSADGSRRQLRPERADDVDLSVVPVERRACDALLLAPVAGELGSGLAHGFQAEVVGAIAQGWLRDFDASGLVSPRHWRDPAADLSGVHVLFLSEHDLPDGGLRPEDLLRLVPMVAVTRGFLGVDLLLRDSRHQVPSWPRPEVDATGAGDVFAASFLVRYHETLDPLEAAAFACCSASCVVEGVGATALGDRSEVQRRLLARERLLEEGEWDD